MSNGDEKKLYARSICTVLAVLLQKVQKDYETMTNGEWVELAEVLEGQAQVIREFSKE